MSYYLYVEHVTSAATGQDIHIIIFLWRGSIAAHYLYNTSLLVDTLSVPVVCLLSDPRLTPSNMSTALPADKWEEFGAVLYVPESKRDQIMSQFTSDEERKDEVIRIYHAQHAHPSWEHVSDILYKCGGVYDSFIMFLTDSSRPCSALVSGSLSNPSPNIQFSEILILRDIA